MSSALAARRDAIEHLHEHPEVSVLIVGGGINGAGLFRELALQGVDVVLVERNDFCAGASAASSRMIHGGLRYLEFGEFRLVREALKERNRLLENAPHYVAPLPTAIPVLCWFSGIGAVLKRFLHLPGQRPAHRGALMVKLGLTFYDVFTWGSRLTPRHGFTGRAAALTKRPALTPKLRCTARYHDAWISYPERLCLEVLQDGEAACPKARALNYMALEQGTGDAVTLRDGLTGDALTVRPRIVVNATGAWIDFANERLGRKTRLIGGTKGAHLVLDHPELFETLAGEMIYYENSDGRVAVALPWLGKALVGSTDIRIEDPDEARCEENEVDYIFAALREVLPGLDINRGHIVSRFSGVRPLPYSDAEATVAVSRDHKCDVIEPGDALAFPVFSLIGGKWTTFRAFAEQVADKLLPRLGTPRRAATHDVAIGGGKDYPRGSEARRAWVEALAGRTGLARQRVETLLARYGAHAARVAEHLAAEQDAPLASLPSYSRREMTYLAEREAVAHLDDLLVRRTAIALLGEASPALLDELADLLAPLLGWDDAARREEIARTKAILAERFGVVLAETS